MYIIAKEAARLNLSFCALQEVRHRGTGNKIIELNTGEKYQFYWCGQKKRRDYGVGILVKVNPRIIITEPDFNTPRVMAINLTMFGFKIRVIIAYSPTNVEENINKKDEFYRDLKKASESVGKNRQLVFTGDFNAETAVVLGKTEFNSTVTVEDSICNDNGQRLKSFCQAKHLCIPQSYFDHPLDNRYTWYSCDGKTKKVLDYVLTNNFVQRFITDCVVNPDFKVDSDHRLLVTSIQTPMNKASRWKPRKKKTQALKDINALENMDIRSAFIDQTKENLQQTKKDNLGPSEISENIVRAFQRAASSTLPNKLKMESKRLWRDDNELNELLEHRSNMNKENIGYKSISKQIKKRIVKLRNLKLKEEAEEVNSFASKRKIEEMYRAFKNDSSCFKNGKTDNKCDPQALINFFKDHFSMKTKCNSPKELIETPNFNPPLSTNPSRIINVEPPTMSELTNILKKLKRGKSANDIAPAFIKCSLESNEMMEEILNLYRIVWETKTVPDKWGLSRLVALWKGSSKGKRTDPTAYRGLQIGSTLCKILMIIILDRLRDWYDENLLDQQQGFRQGRGTTDGIYLVKRLQQISNIRKKRMYILFIDLTAAFDHVNRDWLFASIRKRFPNHTNNLLFELLQSLYSNTKTALDGDLDSVFETYVGVRQGGPESPFLYNLYMDYVLRVFMIECNKKNIKFTKLKYLIPSKAIIDQNNTNLTLGKYGQFVVDWIGYADDLVLIFDNMESLQQGLSLLDDIFTRFQLSINVSKTKTMIFGHEGEYPTTIASLNNINVDNVSEFRYLGALIDYKSHLTGDSEINFRIDSAIGKFYQHGKKFMNKRISLKTRVLLLNSLIRSRLTYACQTWCLTVKQRDSLDVSYNRVLRMMVRNGFKRKENSWAYVLSNEELYRICSTESISVFVNRQQQRYIAHILRKEDNSMTKRLTFNDNVSHQRGAAISLLKNVMKRDGRPPSAFYSDCLSKKL